MPPDPATWIRKLVFKQAIFIRTVFTSPVWLDQRIVGKQTTISRRNKLWPNAQRVLHSTSPALAESRRILSNQDLGWGFTTTKHNYREVSYPIKWSNGANNRSATGLLKAVKSDALETNPIWPSPGIVDDAYLVGAGSIAIARCQPSSPAANMAIALAELVRDRPKRPGKALSKKKRNILKNVSNEYLNYVFGWAPFLNDAADLYQAINNHEAIMKQYHRDAGKHVRRGYKFPEIKTVSVSESTAYLQPAPLAGIEPWEVAVPLTLEITTIRKLWFKGCFMYTIPGMDTILNRVRRAQQELNRLYGIKITPDVLYALTPYSWLADWFGSIGSSLENASNFALSNQAMHYGYIMCETTVTHKYTARCANKLPLLPKLNYDLVQEFETVTKQRKKASPYGFGLNPQLFTDQQWAILAALGISRGPKFLGVDQ